MQLHIAILLLFALSSTTLADVRVPRIFADNMVLQQESNNAIWGWAEAGENVTVKSSWGLEATGMADDDGNWIVFLETPTHGTGHSLTIIGNNKIELRNVAIGEVWLCAGQSNMGWALGNTFGGKSEAESANAPNFRIFKSQREHWHEPLAIPRDQLAKWSPCTPETAAATSAVSYYFGKKLHDELDIPIGIIVQAYAGTPIEGWMPYEIQQDDPAVVAHKEAYDKLSKRHNREEALAKFEKELAEYQAKIARGETMKNAQRQLQPPMIAQPQTLGHQYPAHIFNAMIYPIRPFGIRGAIWYQGERNSKNPPKAENYARQLNLLINYYRSSWHHLSNGNVADDFPFLFTQLPSYGPPQTAPVESDEQAPWAINRESMRHVVEEKFNTGMVVSIDTGDEFELHPKNKKPIGLRHGYLALARVYGKDVLAAGPMYQHSRIDGSKIKLEFDSIGSGLMSASELLTGSPGKLDAFAIAGADRTWHWAEASIAGEMIEVSSPDVQKPIAVRYAWAMNPSRRNLLYNKEGFPASPFRTDDWPFDKGDYNAAGSSYDKPKKPNGYESKDWARPKMNR